MATTYTAIASQVVSGTPTSVIFSSIPNTYTDLVLKVSSRSGNNGNSFANTRIQFNGDTASNYSSIIVRGSSTAASSVSDNSDTSFLTYVITSGSTATANTFGTQEFYFPNYAATGTKQNIAIGAGENNSAAASSAWVGAVSSLYRGTSAISSITITLDGSTIATGSRFDLYGLLHA